MEQIKIQNDILIEDLVERYPDAIPWLSERGIVCLVCGEPAWGTLEELARKKGIENIDELVNQLSEYLTKVAKGEIAKTQKKPEDTIYLEIKPDDEKDNNKRS